MQDFVVLSEIDSFQYYSRGIFEQRVFALYENIYFRNLLGAHPE